MLGSRVSVPVSDTSPRMRCSAHNNFFLFRNRSAGSRSCGIRQRSAIHSARRSLDSSRSSLERRHVIFFTPHVTFPGKKSRSISSVNHNRLVMSIPSQMSMGARHPSSSGPAEPLELSTHVYESSAPMGKWSDGCSADGMRGDNSAKGVVRSTAIALVTKIKSSKLLSHCGATTASGQSVAQLAVCSHTRPPAVATGGCSRRMYHHETALRLHGHSRAARTSSRPY